MGCAPPDPRQGDDLRSLKGRLPRAVDGPSEFSLSADSFASLHPPQAALGSVTLDPQSATKDEIKTNNLRLLRGGRKERSRAEEKGGHLRRKLAFSQRCPAFFNGALSAPSGLLRSPPVNALCVLPATGAYCLFSFKSSIANCGSRVTEPSAACGGCSEAKESAERENSVVPPTARGRRPLRLRRSAPWRGSGRAQPPAFPF